MVNCETRQGLSDQVLRPSAHLPFSSPPPKGAEGPGQTSGQRQLLGGGAEPCSSGAPQEAKHGRVAPGWDDLRPGPGALHPAGTQGRIGAIPTPSPRPRHHPPSYALQKPIPTTRGFVPTQAGFIVCHRLSAAQPAAAKCLWGHGCVHQGLLGEGGAPAVFTSSTTSLRLLCSKCLG